MINMRLAQERGLSSEKVVMIEILHDKRDAQIELLQHIEDAGVEGEYTYQLEWLGRFLEHLEATLQSYWGFSVDPMYTNYSALPCCQCMPTLNSRDHYDRKCHLHKHHFDDEKVETQSDSSPFQGMF